MSDLNSLNRILSEVERLRDCIVNEIKIIQGNNQLAIQSSAENEIDEFAALRSLYESPEWPLAASPNEIANQHLETEKKERASNLAKILIDQSLNEMKFLDYGCNEGYLVNEASRQSTQVCVGYDIQVYPSPTLQWESKDNYLLTTDFEKVRSEGPYDVICLIDVIDHVIGEHPVDLLKKVHSLLKDDGIVIMRCHPWISRHGSHLYHQANKAFLHLIFTPDELKKLGLTTELPSERVYMPLKQYGDWIAEAGFRTRHDAIITRNRVEAFFHKNIIANRIIRNCAPFISSTTKFPEFQIEQSFLDYTLVK